MLRSPGSPTRGQVGPGNPGGRGGLNLAREHIRRRSRSIHEYHQNEASTEYGVSSSTLHPEKAEIVVDSTRADS